MLSLRCRYSVFAILLFLDNDLDCVHWLAFLSKYKLQVRRRFVQDAILTRVLPPLTIP
jgi:hypothetical protein